MLTLVVYFWLILYAQRQLARRPYVLFRNNNVLLRTQVGQPPSSALLRTHIQGPARRQCAAASALMPPV